MSTRSKVFTRRQFLVGLGAGGLSLVSCGRASWPVRGSGQTLRLVFYTDVHARTEWDTPVALAQATQAINASNPDLVLAGGDLITDGFQSSAATVAPRWDVYVNMHEGIEADLYPAIGNHDLVAAIPEDGTPPPPIRARSSASGSVWRARSTPLMRRATASSSSTPSK